MIDATRSSAVRRHIGRYVLHELIAVGGMGSIHFGRLVGGRGFSRVVAVKRVLPRFADDPSFFEMLAAEALLASRVRHPNVVATVDVVEQKTELFVVMEYTPGIPLDGVQQLTKARTNAPPPAEITAAILAGVLRGLHAAHEATDERGQPLGIVHRDVSPHNILVGEDGLARVLDFGVARASAQASSDGSRKGKIAYMSPEQLDSGDLDRRSDVYAAGIVLWEVISGERYLTRPSVDTARARARHYVSPMAPGPRGVADRLDAICRRALQSDKAARFATAEEMAEAIEAAITPATPTQLKTWLGGLGGDVLAAQSERFRAVENDEMRASEAPLPTRDPTAVTEIGHELVPARAVPRGNIARRTAILAAAGAATAIVAVSWAGATGRLRSPPATADSHEHSAPPSAATESALGGPVEAPAPVSTGSAAPRASETRAGGVRRPPSPQPRASSSAARAKRPSCKDPFTVDQTGTFIPKPECF